MKRLAGDARRSGWARWLSPRVGSVGLLGTAGCLVPDTDYCALVYGDRSCPEDRGSCVLAKETTAHTGIDDGCSASVPRDFVSVHYGLPTSVAASEDRPGDPRSLQGMLSGLGYEGCATVDELETRLGPTVAGVADVRRHLEERGHTRRAAMALDSGHVAAIVAFDVAVTALIDECLQSGTETGGSGSESSGPTGDGP